MQSDISQGGSASGKVTYINHGPSHLELELLWYCRLMSRNKSLDRLVLFPLWSSSHKFGCLLSSIFDRILNLNDRTAFINLTRRRIWH